MKLVDQCRLFFQMDRSDKVYEVDLCELEEGRFVVNFRYGRRGASLQDGTKTKTPVDSAAARKIFDKLVEGKRKKGYRAEGEAAAGAADPELGGSEEAAAILLERLGRQPTKGEPRLERTIWRVGERRIPGAVPRLCELAREPDAKKGLSRRYCIAWALGRIGDAGAVGALETLIEDPDPAVRRIALHSLRLCSPEPQRAQLLEGGLGRLPDEIRQAVLDGDGPATFERLAEHLIDAPRDEWAVVELLYLLDGHAAARAAVLRWLRETPFAPPAFQRIRHILKAAELRLDAEVLGLLMRRLEVERSTVDNEYGYGWVEGRWVAVNQELRKPDSRVAYPSKTRKYLRRRSIRTLRRLAELGAPEFVDVASEVLLAYTDADGVEPYRREWWSWEQDQMVRVHFDRFAPFNSFNWLLYRHSPRYRKAGSGFTWACQANYRPGGAPPVVREEAFPRLWDARPDALVRLLVESRCSAVHEFAARILKGRHEDVDAVPVATLVAWLAKPYEPTVALALESARRRWNPEAPDIELVRALLDAELDEARSQAEAWILAAPRVFLADAELLTHLVTHRRADTRSLGRRLLRDFALPPTVDADALAARLLAALLAFEASTEEVESRAGDVGEVLRLAFASQMRHLGLGVIRDLLSHPVPAVQMVGARLLVDHETPVEELPAELFTLLLDAESDELRGMGVRLVSKLPVAHLAQQEDLVLAYCVSAAAPVRAGARSLLVKVAAEDPAFASALTAALAVRLLRPERHDGLHADVLDMVREDLAASVPSLSPDLTWRLLRSQRAAAQSLGALRLTTLPDDVYSVRKTALLARHAAIDVRREAWRRLAAEQGRTLEQLDDVFVALDTDWDDSREQGFTFFRRHVPESHWTPRRLVALCDSVREDVQRFGQELIQRFFDGAKGAEYLLQLSQHPAPSMQLFATHYLERYAAGHVDRLQALEPYFRTVLGQVHRGRVAKDRVLAFLVEQGLESEDAARIVLPLLERLSATVARGDRGATLAAMVELGAAYPLLPSPLTVRRPPLRAARGGPGMRVES